MNKARLVGFAALLILVLVGIAAAQDATDADLTDANLIYNGGFERLREGAIDGWFGEGGKLCTGTAHTGNQSMKLEPGAKMGALGIASSETLKYLVAGWFKSEGNRDCGLYVDFYAPGDRLVSTVRLPVEKAAGEWEYVEGLVEVPREAGCVSVGVYNDGAEVVRADDIITYERYQARLKKTDKPPVIDGRLDDPCWADASVGEEDWITTTGKVARQQTRVFCCYDDDHLYIGFRLYTSAPHQLKADETRDDFYIWRDDSAEVFIDTNHDHATYCELVVNPKNFEYDAWESDKDWECLWEHQVGFEKDAWICEIAIDLASFEFRDRFGKPTDRTPLPTVEVWGINFSRNDFVTHESSSWPNTGRSFHNVPAYGHLLRFQPHRTAAYTVQAQYRLQALQRDLDICRYVMKKAGYQRAPEGRESRSPENWALGMASRLQADIDRIAAGVKPDNDYDAWVQLRVDLDSAGVYGRLLHDALQPQIARRHWENKLGESVSMAASLSPAPIERDGFCAQWRLDDGFCLYMARDDISGFGVAVDALAGVKGISAEVDIEGLWQGAVELVHMPGLADHESFHWPRASVDLADGQRATFWVPVKTSAGTAPGVYSGVLTVTAADHPPLCQQFKVKVWDFAVPQSDALGLSVLHPDFAAADITGDLAGYGLPDGSVAVYALPLPADGKTYSGKETHKIVADAAGAWGAFRETRPELDGYLLGALAPSAEIYPELAKLYAAVKRATGGCPIMQIISAPQPAEGPEWPEWLDKWVDIWAVSGPMWNETDLGRQGRDQRWLYYALPGFVIGGNPLADARVQPWIARHLQADGIVWGIAQPHSLLSHGSLPSRGSGFQPESRSGTGFPLSPSPRERGAGGEGTLSFPMFEMYCRMIALGHRDCDYFEYLYNDLARTRLRAKPGKHWRLSGNVGMATRLYPTVVISPTWYYADYMFMRQRRITCGKLIERLHRHLQPLW